MLKELIKWTDGREVEERRVLILRARKEKREETENVWILEGKEQLEIYKETKRG